SHYNNRQAVPEHPQIIERWNSSSSVFRASADCQLDIPYGTGDRHTLDLFRSQGHGLLIFLHGGYWQALSKDYFSFLASGPASRGMDVAICNYPLCPGVTLDGILESVQQAVVYLLEHAHELGRNWQTIRVAGHSAGGQLAAMLMATDWSRTAPQLNKNSIDSSVCISGIFDLEPLRFTTINARLGLDQRSARLNSPMKASPTSQSPMLLVTGGEESQGFHDQMTSFAEKRRSQGVPVEMLVAPGLNHFTVVDQLADPESLLLHKLFQS
ncbi:MAG: alpha/beta hydrolase, partial [Gammaproteobacteria bacterium]|nr:alpha/beta hydrolase [Gammaproteobacteria bacterium]